MYNAFEMPTCPMCERVSNAERDPLFVARLEAGVAFLFNRQFYPGYTLFVSRRHATELFELSAPECAKFLEGMVLVAAAVHAAFRPRKINYELLGNAVPHLHWHIVPRYRNDPTPRSPIWELDAAIREGPGTEAAPAAARARIRRLRRRLGNVGQRSLALLSNFFSAGIPRSCAGVRPGGGPRRSS